MPTIECPECNEIVSDQAVACPHCGLPEPDKYREKLLNQDIEKYLKKANEGDPDAQNKLGNALSHLGKFKEGLNWYHKAAKQGWPNSMSNIGARYLLGHGVKQDINLALKWYEKSIKLKFIPSCAQLAEFYHNGEILPKDNSKAIKYWLLGAELGDAQCAYFAGCILFGFPQTEVQTNYYEAQKCFKRAYELGMDGADTYKIIQDLEELIKSEQQQKRYEESIRESEIELNKSITAENAKDALNSKLAAAGGHKCPSCELMAGVKMSAKDRGSEFGEALATMGSPLGSLMKTYKCKACGYVW